MEHSAINNFIITHPQSTVPPTLIEHTEYRIQRWRSISTLDKYSGVFNIVLYQITMHFALAVSAFTILANNITFLYLAEVAENSMQTNAIK